MLFDVVDLVIGELRDDDVMVCLQMRNERRQTAQLFGGLCDRPHNLDRHERLSEKCRCLGKGVERALDHLRLAFGLDDSVEDIDGQNQDRGIRLLDRNPGKTQVIVESLGTAGLAEHPLVELLDPGAGELHRLFKLDAQIRRDLDGLYRFIGNTLQDILYRKRDIGIGDLGRIRRDKGVDTGPADEGAKIIIDCLGKLLRDKNNRNDQSDDPDPGFEAGAELLLLDGRASHRVRSGSNRLFAER